MTTNVQPVLKPFGAAAAMSTPTQDTQPVVVVSDEFGVALRLLREGALSFAQSIIKDPVARGEYSLKIKAAADELLGQVMRKQITPHEAAISANAIRNQIMEIMRRNSTEFGRAIAIDIKAQGRTLIDLQEKYAKDLFKRGFNDLTHAERNSVWCAIVASAGRSKKSVNTKVQLYGVAGKALLISTLALAVYDILEAQDKVREFGKQSLTIGAGAAVGVVTGIAMGSTPPGWVVGAVMFVAGVLAAEGSSVAFDYLWPEL